MVVPVVREMSSRNALHLPIEMTIHNYCNIVYIIIIYQWNHVKSVNAVAKRSRMTGLGYQCKFY